MSDGSILVPLDKGTGAAYERLRSKDKSRSFMGVSERFFVRDDASFSQFEGRQEADISEEF